MGLDYVELIMALEERFGIAIPDEDAEHLSTPGKVADYVFSKVQQATQPTCLTQRSFHLLRRGWLTTLNTPRSQFRLDSELEGLIPLKDRRQTWESLGQHVGALTWPELEFPRPLLVAVWATPVTSFVAIYLWMIQGLHYDSLTAAIASFAITLVIACLLPLAAKPFKRNVPQEIPCVKELTEFLVSRNPRLVKGDDKKWTREEVYLAVREVVIEQCGTSDFNEDSNFITDIGLD